MTDTDPDPKGLIRESYRIDGITEAECRSIFLDWALSIPVADPRQEIEVLLTIYGPAHPEHPMTAVLSAGLERSRVQGRRGGRQGRRPPGGETG
jgi:hypothetical protein